MAGKVFEIPTKRNIRLQGWLEQKSNNSCSYSALVILEIFDYFWREIWKFLAPWIFQKSRMIRAENSWIFFKKVDFLVSFYGLTLILVLYFLNIALFFFASSFRFQISKFIQESTSLTRGSLKIGPVIPTFQIISSFSTIYQTSICNWFTVQKKNRLEKG
jgi:hypothetical protein